MTMPAAALLASRLRGSAAPLLLCGFAAVLVAGVWHATLSRINEGRTRLMADATRDAATLARLVEEHSVRTIQSADQAVQFIRYEFARQGTALDPARMVEQGVVQTDTVLLYSIIGPDGKVLKSSQAFAPTNLADREHFAVHRDHPERGLFISKPVLGRVTQRWSIQLTRRIDGPGGAFGGVVVVSMDPFYFTRLYESARLGPHSAVSLVGDDGIVRARRSGGVNDIGLDVSKSPMFQAITRQPSGGMTRKSVLDGRERVYAFRRIGNYPLHVVVGLDTDDILDQYTPLKDKLLQQALLVTLAIAGFTALLLVLVQRLVLHRAEALSASAAKTEFLSNMSHELRTPLNGILGYAELLHEDLPDGEPREFARIIHDSGTHLLALVNQVLQLNKIEAGKERLALEPVDLRQLVGQVLNAHRSSARTKGLGLYSEIARATPQQILGDRIKLMQVLNNLLHNAIKFTERGAVTVSLAPCAEGLRFEVRDTGRGIAHEMQEQVFEKFFQVDSHAARTNHGTGLGLALVRELVELMDGTVRLDSQPGMGSSFSFTLPAVPAPAAELEMAA
jgi:two-component system, NarL family, sensor histidine kinase BarA